MKKSIVLCADDYGQAPEISQAIITLIEKHRLSATSCMVTSPYWQEHSKWLQAYRAHADIGLHFNLTEGKALSPEYIQTYGAEFFPLKQLLKNAFLYGLDEAVIEAECHAQIDRFYQAMGYLPDFLDGHHHAHQFPVVRNAVLKAYLKHYPEKGAYLRWVGIKPSFNLKKTMIYLTGTKAFKALLNRHEIPHNKAFSGIYPFRESYRPVFLNFLKDHKKQLLIMCHPGLLNPHSIDPINSARYQEFQYFNSEVFDQDCQANHLLIQRFPRSEIAWDTQKTL